MGGGSNGSAVTTAPASNTVCTRVSGTDLNNGCVGTTTFAVNTNSLPVIAIAASAASVCPGSTATFTASGANSFTRTVVKQPGSVVSITPSANAVYTVSGTTILVALAQKLFPRSVQSTAISVTPQTSTICFEWKWPHSVLPRRQYFHVATGRPEPNFTFASPCCIITNYTVTGTDGNNCPDNSAM